MEEAVVTTARRRRSAHWVWMVEPVVRTAGILVALLVLLTLAGLTHMTTPGTVTIPGVVATAGGR
jgi:hypothetical protein